MLGACASRCSGRTGLSGVIGRGQTVIDFLYVVNYSDKFDQDTALKLSSIDSALKTRRRESDAVMELAMSNVHCDRCADDD